MALFYRHNVDCSIIIATCGRGEWADLAWSRAYPSAAEQGAHEVLIEHYPAGYSVGWARNVLAERATGEFLCHLDADDELEPGYLAAMSQAFLEGAIFNDWSPLLVPALRRVWPDCRESVPEIPNRGLWPAVNECVIGTLIRRDRFEALGGFNADLTSIEDYDLFLRAYDAGARLVYVEGAVYRECVNPAGRNLDQSPYAAIWAEHERRIGA